MPIPSLRGILKVRPSSLGLVCGSAFLEFLGALFDVSQILVRGAADDQREYVIDPADLSWEGGREDDWCTGGVQANDGVCS